MVSVDEPAERSGERARDDNEQATAEFEPRITAFVCNWCTYTGADLAGTSRLHMASNVRIIRLPCTGRIDHLFIVKAFERGADGVIVSGCHPADCHYTAGNYHARRRFGVFRELLSFLGVDPERLTFSWVSASEGGKWADVVNETVERVRAWGRSTPTTGSPARRRRPTTRSLRFGHARRGDRRHRRRAGRRRRRPTPAGTGGAS